MRAIVITYPTPKDIARIIDIQKDDYVIAVDQALDYAMEQHIPIDLVVGDFDSLNNHALLNNIETVQLPVEKDVTDTFQALYEAKKRGYDALYLIGGFRGSRIEHFMVHLMFFNTFDCLRMMNEETTIYLKKEGVYTFSKNCYYSFFPYPEAILSLKGFKYPLDLYQLQLFDPLCISNELQSHQGELTVHQGALLVVESNKK